MVNHANPIVVSFDQKKQINQKKTPHVEVEPITSTPESRWCLPAPRTANQPVTTAPENVCPIRVAWNVGTATAAGASLRVSWAVDPSTSSTKG